LTISGRDKTWKAEASAQGTIIGRSAQCDVVVETKDISRKHARIFRDPFGRWIVEDLDSRNGVYINGQRIEAQAILPGDQIDIGLYSVTLEQPLDEHVTSEASVHTSSTLTEDGLTPEVMSDIGAADKVLSRPYLEQLNEIIERLSRVTSLSGLYIEVCRYLSQAPRTVAAVLKMSKNTEPAPEPIDILACRFGDDADDNMSQDTTNLCLSRKVVEAVRFTSKAVMATSTYSSDAAMHLTVVDEHTPRAVICTPLSDVSDAVVLLYLDLPSKATTPDTFEFVKAVSRQAILSRKMLLLTRVKAERGILDDQLSLAREIQSRLTSVTPPDLPAVDLALHYEPAMWVGGDYCDVWSLENGRLAFAIGDVSGKGLPAAMVMSNLQAALRTTMSFCGEPSRIMELVNLHLIQSLPDIMFVTLFLGLFDPCTGALEYVNAGHLQPLIIQPQSTVVPLGQPDNLVLGIESTSFRASVETIQQETGLLVFTDGITEARSPDNEEFGVNRVVNLLGTAGNRPVGEIVDSVVAAVEDFRQSCPQQDDITVFTLFYRGSSDTATV